MSKHQLRTQDPARRRRHTVLVLLAVAAGLLAVPTVGSAAATKCSTHSAGSAKHSACSTRRGTGTNGVLDLHDWYLTLPTGTQGNPDTVHQPDLDGYSSDWFGLNDTGDGVVFTARTGGVTTAGSRYPRSELREMDGAKKAGWSNTSGTHTLSVRQAVTQLPSAKPDVVTAQIHDTASDVIEVRLQGTRLIAQYDDGHTDATLDDSYTLGTPYDLKIVAGGGRIQVFYNHAKKVDIARKGSGWYFKTGSYVQSNPSRGDKPDAVGVVVIYALATAHSS